MKKFLVVALLALSVASISSAAFAAGPDCGGGSGWRGGIKLPLLQQCEAY
ncbi:hypothetical protein [Brevibacillus daliensis]|nr:hypothetical protein [Brevibacillus daliensis]